MASVQNQSILHFLKAGEYLEDDSVLKSTIANGTLPQLRTELQRARIEAESGIRSISRDVASDVDGWISRAKQLQADIAQSRSVAREVVAEAQNAQYLQNTLTDASKKETLLRGETNFNDRLLRSLSHMRSAYGLLRAAQQSAAAGSIEEALIRLQELENAIEEMAQIQQTSAVELLQQRSLDMRKGLIDTANHLWSSVAIVDKRKHIFTIKNATSTAGKGDAASIEDVARISASLGILDAQQSRLCHDLQEGMLAPLLAKAGDLTGDALCVEEQATGEGESALLLTRANDARDILESLSFIISYLDKRLPKQLARSLSKDFMPPLVRRLLSFELHDAIPTSLDDLPAYQELLGRVKSFAKYLDSVGWAGGKELSDWTEQDAKVWLAKRREVSISSIRDLLFTKLDSTAVVERTETQTISRGDAIADDNDKDDEWDESWGEDSKDDNETAEHATGEVEEEDMSGWDEDEDALQSRNHATNGNHSHSGDGPDEEADAWGWDEQHPENEMPASPVRSRKSPQPKVNGNHPTHAKAAATKELTLRETYTITALPDALSDLIIHLISDSSALQQPPRSTSPAGPAANGLLSIPTLTLAAYRALAPSHYDPLSGGPMYLYNDTLRLSELLSSLLTTVPPATATRTNLSTDITTLTSFGRRAYGRAMEAHRTILRDLIDNAQGFVNCTTPPYAAECANAVSATVAHIQRIAAEWDGVLSRSALLQSLGSLASTVISKMLVDISEMADIGADESERLVQFCREVMSGVEPLFRQVEPESGESRGVAALYVRGWTRFEWLAMVLESNLADIRWMWKEGGLREDFEVDEVVDLLEALFADNEHRRRAIGEIRRG